MLGVGLGVAALLIALALMTGLQGEVRDRIVGAAAHVYVFKIGGMQDWEREVARLRELPRVVGAAPVVIGKALATTPSGEAFITVKGILPDYERTVTDLERSMVAGGLEGLDAAPEAQDGILIGRDLAQTLGVSVGDLVQVISPEGTLTPFGPMMRQRSLRVAGLFNLGLYEFDAGYGFVRLDVGQRLFGKEAPDYIELRVDDLSIPDRLGAEYLPQDWADMNRSLFSALWLEKMVISIAVGLIVMVAAFNIVTSLVLLVMEKNRDIAILKTMGASAGSIRWIFMLQGLIIGLVGTTGGALAGGALIHVFDRYRLIRLPVDVYQITYVPFTLQPLELALVVAGAVLICFLATIYPSRQAARLDPAQALRYQ
jgi:lipoprotein-releasing system permease protein